MLGAAGGLGADSAPWPWGVWSGDGFQSDETLADLSGGLHGGGSESVSWWETSEQVHDVVTGGAGQRWGEQGASTR